MYFLSTLSTFCVQTWVHCHCKICVLSEYTITVRYVYFMSTLCRCVIWVHYPGEIGVLSDLCTIWVHYADKICVLSQYTVHVGSVYYLSTKFGWAFFIKFIITSVGSVYYLSTKFGWAFFIKFIITSESSQINCFVLKINIIRENKISFFSTGELSGEGGSMHVL